MPLWNKFECCLDTVQDKVRLGSKSLTSLGCLLIQ
jgi:hypothetical protein